jgi:hypothetical protein
MLVLILMISTEEIHAASCSVYWPARDSPSNSFCRNSKSGGGGLLVYGRRGDQIDWYLKSNNFVNYYFLPFEWVHDVWQYHGGS